jgi:hypothetical protein
VKAVKVSSEDDAVLVAVSCGTTWGDVGAVVDANNLLVLAASVSWLARCCSGSRPIDADWLSVDAFAAKLPKWKWLQRYIAGNNWETKIREITHDAPLDPTVKIRAGLRAVTRCANVGPYRPDALRGHDELKGLY